jgi:ABC-type polysaccharide/polyol phosphate export permease
MVPPDLQWLAHVNPLTAPVELFKSGILPQTSVSWPWVGYSVAVTLVVFAGGIWHFTRSESATLDKL